MNYFDMFFDILLIFSDKNMCICQESKILFI
jgi:hypothetical protein